MCCLFGLLDYGHRLSLKQRQRILRTLSIACEARGTDATGIAFFSGSHLTIQKAPRPARRMHFRIPGNARYIIGHTRMTTQGDERKNYNNHPFAGCAGNMQFALAHNGVLHNDLELRKQEHLPETIIETDSYVAVQLLEKFGHLNARSLATMAEALRGSFTISLLDDNNNLYIVKGNNPACVYHFYHKQFYLYASTQEILQAAVTQMRLHAEPHQVIKPQSGEILVIRADGSVATSRFNDKALWEIPYLRNYSWSNPLTGKQYPPNDDETLIDEYAQITGTDRNIIQMLHDAGYDWLDIEQMLYDPEYMSDCIGDLLYGVP